MIKKGDTVSFYIDDYLVFSKVISAKGDRYTLLYDDGSKEMVSLRALKRRGAVVSRGEDGDIVADFQK